MAIHTSAAASRGTTSSALRPEGNRSATTSIQGGPRLRRPLLKEEFAADPVGIAHQHVRTAARSLQGALGDRDVVASEIELGIARLREEHLARIGDRHFASRDGQELLFGRARHALTIAKTTAARLVARRQVQKRPAATPERGLSGCLGAGVLGC